MSNGKEVREPIHGPIVDDDGVAHLYLPISTLNRWWWETISGHSFTRAWARKLLIWKQNVSEWNRNYSYES